MSWGTIIIIIIALWGVISQVLEAAARKAKEKKRQEEMKLKASRELGATVQKPERSSATFTMERQEPEGGHPGHLAEVRTRSTASQPTPYRPGKSQPTQSTARSRLGGGESDLAARRRAQLEQLRQRRSAQIDPRARTTSMRSGSQGVQPAPPPSPFQSTQPRPKSPGPRPTRQPATPPPAAQPPAQRPARQSYRSGRPLSAPMESTSGKTSQQSVEDLVSAMESRKGQKKPPHDAYSMPTLSRGLRGSMSRIGRGKGSGPNVGALKNLLSSPASLRQVFLAKELLDGPVSLRTDPEHGYLSG